MTIAVCKSICLDWAVTRVATMVNEGHKVAIACQVVADEFNQEYPSSNSTDSIIYVEAKPANIRSAYYRKNKGVNNV